MTTQAEREQLVSHLESELHDYKFGPGDDPTDPAGFYAVEHLHLALHQRGDLGWRHHRYLPGDGRGDTARL